MEDLLELERVGPLSFRSNVHQTNRNGALYGGQLIAQALAAAAASVADRRPHALQVSFQAAGTARAPLAFDVECTRDGSSLSARRVVGTQEGKVVVMATASFSEPDDGYAHEQRWQAEPPAPETLPSMEELEKRHAHQASAHGRGRLRCYPQIDVRPIDAPEHLLMRPGEARCRFWIRARMRRDANAPTRRAALAFLSDYLLVNAALVPHVAELPASRLFVASLNHSIWFHRDGDPGDWLLYQTDSPWAGSGHVLCQGRFYSKDGRMLASTTQEALVRPMAERSRQELPA